MPERGCPGFPEWHGLRVCDRAGGPAQAGNLALQQHESQMTRQSLAAVFMIIRIPCECADSHWISGVDVSIHPVAGIEM